MMENNPPKDDTEHPLPDEWRPLFRGVAEAFASGDYALKDHAIADVARPSADAAESIRRNIIAYGDTLVPLNDEVWHSSVCLWMAGYWEVILDLSTATERVSDLILLGRLYEDRSPRLEIVSVHVP